MVKYEKTQLSDITSLKDACARTIVELKTITAKRKGTLLDVWSNASKKSQEKGYPPTRYVV